jgi:molybdopterin-guanine dinucleotide biosynthesis protein A
VFDAVVLAGGAARRLGGQDKPGLEVGGRSMLDAVLAATAAAGRTVVVGPERPTQREVVWTCEDPIGGGPVPALQAGLAHVTAGTVVLLAADLPFVTAPFVRWLAELAPAVLVVDGREQWLCSAWPTEALRAPAGSDRLGAVLGALPHQSVSWDGDGTPWLDCDTDDDLARARAQA